MIVSVLMLALLIGGAGFVFAQDAASEEVDTSEEIATKKANIDQINRKIDEYKKEIERRGQDSASLSGELSLLENRMAKAELDIELNEVEIDLVNTELRQLDDQINALESRLQKERNIIEEILQEIQVYDNDLSLQVLFGSDSFSELFDHLQYLETVNADLGERVAGAKAAKEQVVSSRTAQEGKKARLEELQANLARMKTQLTSEVHAKESILHETQSSAAQYSVLLSELKQERASIDYQVNELQNKLGSQVNPFDNIGDSSSMSWPVNDFIITALYHDKTYPFRHLFEHSGLDLAVPQGTPLKSAAPGYVAWTRTGKMYGNYVMIIHSDGLATLYAHMSAFNVESDQFVGRGQVIGWSGGLPGTQGAGLSTGPHLHFEVRKNGIPVNPQDYLLGD